MKFREAMEILKSTYGATAALSFTVIINKDGREVVDIAAHGGGQCVCTTTYAGALAGLAELNAGDTEEPQKEASNG